MSYLILKLYLFLQLSPPVSGNLLSLSQLISSPLNILQLLLILTYRPISLPALLIPPILVKGSIRLPALSFNLLELFLSRFLMPLNGKFPFLYRSLSFFQPLS